MTNDILNKSIDKAFRGGVAGASAMGIQVSSLMWLRTTMNYQYRYGLSTSEAIKTLYKNGGIRRFYRGIGPALIQGPLSRFGDTAANAGVLTFLNSHEKTKDLPIVVKTVGASLTAASWRIFLMPVDTVKTILQVEGKNGISKLSTKIKANNPTVLYYGAIGASTATFVGHYPWFATYNILDNYIPKKDDSMYKLSRNAFIGFSSSIVSDTISNSIRVLKTYRQTNDEKISYVKSAKNIIKNGGYKDLFFRGLKTRLIANGSQGILFSILWKYFEEKLNK
jgi:hypothetical protein